MKPEDVFKKIAWRSTLAVGEGLEKATTWTIGGVAGIAALLVGNIDAVSQVVDPSGLKTALVLLAVSLLFGAVSKQFGMSVAIGLESIKQIEAVLLSEAGQRLMDDMTIEPAKLSEEIAEPYIWPMSWLMRFSSRSGQSDPLTADKRLVKIFCLQLFFNFWHFFLAIAALIAVACSL